MKFKSRAKADTKLAKHLSKTETDPAIPQNIKEKMQGFWTAWKMIS